MEARIRICLNLTKSQNQKWIKQNPQFKGERPCAWILVSRVPCIGEKINCLFLANITDSKELRSFFISQGYGEGNDFDGDYYLTITGVDHFIIPFKENGFHQDQDACLECTFHKSPY